MTCNENGLVELDHQQIAIDSIDYLNEFSNQWYELACSIGHQDDSGFKQFREALFDLGKTEQKAFWQLNERMKYPLQQRMIDSQGGGKLTQLLQALQKKVMQIKPPKRALISGLANMFKLLFSWHQSAFQMWMADYPKHKQDITALVSQLEQLKRQLDRDNTILLADKEGLSQEVVKLENCFDLLCALEVKFQAHKVQTEKPDQATINLISDEFLPIIEQRIIEIQQQLLIARQSVMTLELFVHENETQVRGIDQAIYTTTSVIDVTAGILMVEKGQARLAQNRQNTHAIKTSIDNKKLKQARLAIDQALNQMDDVQQQTQKAADGLNGN